MKNNRYAFILLFFLLAGIGNLAMADSPVTVVAPDGGAQWQKGTTRIISWYETGFTQNVWIELWPSGGTAKDPVYGDIVVSTGGTTYPWTIPTGITNGLYEIRVYPYGFPGWTIYGASAPFQIVSTALPFVTVLTPNGAETWARGTTHTITWDDNLTSNVKIELCDPAGASLATIKSSATGNSFNWYIPSNYSVGSYRIKISNVNNPACFDLGNVFQISASTGGTVTVTAPTAGEQWNRGASHLITWTKTFPENVKIELCNAGGGVLASIKNVCAGSSYNWYIPSYYSPGDYTIKVSSVLDGTISDWSDGFRITASQGGTVTVTDPIDGADWNRGAMHLITWTKTFPENVKIELCTPGGDVLALIKNVCAGSSYNWYIPSYYTPGDYTIKVSSVLDGTLRDWSGLFQITASQGGTVTVTAPTAGEQWNRGASHLITWTKTFPENVKIELCNAGGGVLALIKNVCAGSSYNWYIPSYYTPGNYKIKVSSVLDGTLTDDSEGFEITLSAGGDIVITSPAGGEIWAKGTSHPITWEKTCTENVKIDLCDASGNYILTIKNQAPGESLNWYVPNSYSEGTYTIRISSVLDNLIDDLSSTFTLATFKFAVYPNPVIGSVMNLQLDDMLQDECTVEMFDRYGLLVCTVPCSVQASRHLTIPVGHLPNDLYLVVVTSGDLKVSQKVMIQH